jgi:hypothetical protein
MLKLTFLLQLIILVTMVACSHSKPTSGISIATASTGLMKNHIVPFPVYLTDTLEKRSELEKKYSSEVFIVHTGHILKSNLTKEQNEKTLSSLKDLGINLVNLTLEDFSIAEAQGIDFENFDQNFLNSSVIDITQDNLVTGKNIVSYDVHNGIAFIGLSDTKIDKKLSKEKYIVSDYVLAILKVKKTALKTATPTTINSFILIHNLGSGINDVMERLPPSFINSLAD